MSEDREPPRWPADAPDDLRESFARAARGYQAMEELPVPQRDRMWQRLERELSTTVAAPSARWPWVGISAVVVAGVVAAWILVPKPRNDRASSRPPAADVRPVAPPKPSEPLAAARDALEPPPASNVQTPPTPEAAETPTEPARPRVASRPLARAASATTRATAGHGVRELELLIRARRLIRTKPEDALALAEEHRSEHPHSRFVEDRELLAIEALHGLGRDELAAERARRFNATFPNSAHRRRIRGTHESTVIAASTHRVPRRVPIVAMILLPCATAFASPERPALHWVRGAAAESCIDPSRLARHVQGITGPAMVSAALADVSIEARIEHPAADVYEVYIRINPVTGAKIVERKLSFQTSDCRSLDDTIAFLIAMAIDPELGADGIPEELSWLDEQDAWSTAESLRRDLARPIESEVQAQENVSMRLQPKPRAVSDAHASEPRAQPVAPHWQVMAAAVSGNGPSAGAAAGLLLGVSRELTSRFSVAAQVTGTSAFRARKLTAGRSVLTQRLGAALLVCLELPVAKSFELRGCTGPEVGAVAARGRGFASNKSTVSGTFGGTLRAEVQIELASRWVLVAGTLLNVDAVSPGFHYELGANEIDGFRASRFVLQGVLGVALGF